MSDSMWDASQVSRTLADYLASLTAGEVVTVVLSGHRGAGKRSTVHKALALLPEWELVHRTAVAGQAIEGFLLDDATPTALCVHNAHLLSKECMQDALGVLCRAPDQPRALILTVDAMADSSEIRAAADMTFDIPPLDTEQIQRLVSNRLGAEISSRTATEIRRATGGIPHLVQQVLSVYPADHWRQPDPMIRIPEQWRESLHQRTEGLDIQPFLLAACLTSYADAPPSLALLEYLVPNALEQFSTAVNAGIIEAHLVDAQRFVYFRNITDLAALRAFADIPYMRKLHQHAAEFYEQRGDMDAATFHWAMGRTATRSEVCEALLQRATGLANAGQWEAAARFHLLSASIAPTVAEEQQSNLRAVEALISASDIRQAKLHASNLASSLSNPRIDSMRAYLSIHEGRQSSADQLLHRAWATEEDPKARTDVAVRRAMFHLHEWQLDEVLEWDARARKENGGAPAAESYYQAQLAESVLSGRVAPFEPLPDEHHVLAFRREMMLGWLSLVHDNPSEARQRLQFTTRIEGSHRISLWMDVWLARAILLLGEPLAALRVVERGLNRVEQFGLTFLTGPLVWTGCAAASILGDQALARNYNQRAGLIYDVSTIQRITSLMAQMDTAVLLGDVSAGVRAGKQLANLQEKIDFSQPGFWPWEDTYARLLLASGHTKTAEKVVEVAEERSASSSIASARARIAGPKAHLLIQRGDVNAGLTVLDNAVEMLRPLQLPYYEARLLLSMGQVLRRVGKRKHADDVLAQAGDLFSAMGAGDFLAMANRERRASGLGQQSPQFAGLTPQEEEIAQAVAAGATNREVADEFYLSTKTVEYHLTRVYRKLGIRSRSELPRALANK